MYVARESGLHNLHPLTKSAIVLCLLFVGLILPGNWTGYFITIGIIIPLAIWGKIFRKLIVTSWAFIWPIALSVILIQTVFWGKGTPIFVIWTIAPKKEGFIFALLSIGRLILTMSDFMLFAMITRPDSLMISLKQSGMPSSIAYIVVTTLQIIPSFQRKALTIIDAQRSRGLEMEGNLIVRARAFIPIVLPLVLGSLVDVEERAIAIQARAFNSHRKETSLIQIEDTANQILFRKLLVFITFLSIITRLLWK